MKTLIVIPARSGSRGVKDKNIQLVGGSSLIERTIKSVEDLCSDNLDICFSSDSDKYLKHAKSFSSKIKLIKRSKELSSDTALTIDVVKESIEHLGRENYDNILLLQVTTPFRKQNHIKEALFKFKKNNYDSLVSIVNVEGYHPLRMKIIADNYVENYIKQGFENMIPRQQLPDVYIRNGAIYLTKLEHLYNNNSMLSGKTGYFEMSSQESINIDSELDLEFAKFIAKKLSI